MIKFFRKEMNTVRIVIFFGKRDGRKCLWIKKRED
jgi:hypothetical protein